MQKKAEGDKGHKASVIRKYVAAVMIGVPDEDEIQPYCGDCGSKLSKENAWSNYTCLSCAKKMEFVAEKCGQCGVELTLKNLGFFDDMCKTCADAYMNQHKH